ncbi:hypothetical protein AVEN_206490-1 [Araneus ventricosus]|uniref:Gustatory receptor n=1 Tax=Araneus ventricosus TaxID=182803 RepID=A0A4Y2NHU7_ARAVE|nr:hypothetical protein AVEN_206490-1 [Araneus ventricosus]
MRDGNMKKSKNHPKKSQKSKIRSHASPKTAQNIFHTEEKEKAKIMLANSLVGEFKFIFILLRLMAINVREPIITSWRDVSNRIFKTFGASILKLLVFIIFGVKMSIQTFYLIFAEDKTNEFTISFQSVLKMMAYISTYRKRREMFRMTKHLNQLFQVLPCKTLREQKYVFVMYLILSLCFLISWTLRVYFIDTNKIKMENYFLKKNSTTESRDLPSSIFIWSIEASELLFYLITRVIISLFSTYYIFTCRLIRVLLQRLLDEIHNTKKPEILQKYLELHEEIMKSFCNFDTHFSFLAFILVTLCMINLFRAGYALAFFIKKQDMEFYALICALIFYLSVQIILMISGIKTNESAKNVRNNIQNLLKKLRKNSAEISKLDADLRPAPTLSLWKMYEFDRSLITASVGTVLTYGILLGTLGKN